MKKYMLLIIVSFGLLLSFVACSNRGNATGVSSSCTLIVDTQAFGWTDDGKDLSDTRSEHFLVNEGDTVYQTELDGRYTTEESEETAGVVFTIKNIGEDTVTIVLYDRDRELSFSEFVELESLVYAYDGQNYIFTIHFERQE